MSFDLVLFGGTGDLAWRKLMPALFQAFRHGTLPTGGRIIAVARDDLSDEQYRSLIQSRQICNARSPNAHGSRGRSPCARISGESAPNCVQRT